MVEYDCGETVMKDLSRADLVIRNARVYNSYFRKFNDADVYIKDGRFLYIDQKRQNEITADRKAIFDNATETLTGATYTPVTYLGSQVVAGTNHAFLCKSEPSVDELKTSPTWIIVYIYQDFEGKCEIIKTEDVELNI